MSSNSPTVGPDEFYSGTQLYKISIGIRDDHLNAISLDSRFIEMFSYNNQMNRLYLTGYIDYIDTHGIIDRIIESDDVKVSVDFNRISIKKSGKIITKKADISLSLSFILDSAEILSNKPGEIKYRLNLISPQYINLTRKATFTTYNNKKMSPTDIIHELLTESLDIQVNLPSFKTFRAPVEIDYITNQNDDGISSIQYLLNKTIYTPSEYDKTLKTLVIDEQTGVVFLFDTNPSSPRLGIYRPIEIQVIKNSKFPGYESPTYIGYTNEFSRLNTYINTKNMEFYDYNLETNEFGNNLLVSKDIVTILNGGSDNKTPKYIKNTSDNHRRYEMSWNNNINLYTTIFQSITQTNGLITNQEGSIGTLPGFMCNVAIPNNFPILNSKTNTIKNEKTMYQRLTGDWTIFEVEHYISPKEGIFRQKLILFRNDF